MSWNEPGGNGDKKKDPWGNRGGDQGPPDLDEVFKKLNDKIGGLFGGMFGGGKRSGGSSGGGGSSAKPGGLVGVIILALIGWIVYDSAYIVEQAQRGVVLRFGEYATTLEPGLNIRLPRPIEQVFIVNIDQVRTIEVGYRSGSASRAGASVPIEALMLTQDENIIDIKFAVQYRVKNARDYLFNDRLPDDTLRFATESAVREIIGKSKMDFVLTEGRGLVADKSKALIQNIMDRYGTGLEITNVNMQDAQPPEEVQDAFADAVKAREDEQRLKNEAEAYRNDVIPKARGAAARQLAEANAYREQIIARAQGEADRFNQLLTEYKKAPAVTRERLFLEAMESIMTNASKVMVSVKRGNNILYVPLDKIVERDAEAKDVMRDILPGIITDTPAFKEQASKRLRDAVRKREVRR